jgi:hypothetical protein
MMHAYRPSRVMIYFSSSFLFLDKPAGIQSDLYMGFSSDI